MVTLQYLLQSQIWCFLDNHLLPALTATKRKQKNFCFDLVNNMENVCRVCCSPDANLADIYNQSNSTEPSVADMLLECVDCSLRVDDPFPKKICAGCVISTQVAFKFKQQYERSHKRFCQLLENLKKCGKFQTTEAESKQTSEGHILGIGGNEFQVQNIKATETVEMKEDSGIYESEYEVSEVNESIKIEVEDSHIVETEEASYQEDEEAIYAVLENNRKMHYTNEQNAPHSRHALTCGKPEMCKICGHVLPNRIKMIVHLLSHAKGTKRNKCPCCLKIFPDRQRLRRHIVIHSDERPHQCPHCSKSFKSREYLNRHIRLHSDDQRSFNCHLCDQSFANSSKLKHHIRLSHPIYTLPCPDCH